MFSLIYYKMKTNPDFWKHQKGVCCGFLPHTALSTKSFCLLCKTNTVLPTVLHPPPLQPLTVCTVKALLLHVLPAQLVFTSCCRKMDVSYELDDCENFVYFVNGVNGADTLVPFIPTSDYFPILKERPMSFLAGESWWTASELQSSTVHKSGCPSPSENQVFKLHIKHECTVHHFYMINEWIPRSHRKTFVITAKHVGLLLNK